MKRNIFIIAGVVLLAFILNACTQVLDVELKNEDSRIVIEGLVTNQNEPYSVRVSRTIPLDGGNNYPAINNAFVTIGDDLGNLDTLVLTSGGRYETTAPMTGIVGRTYYLTVRVDGITYKAQDKLPAVSPIDSMYTIFLTAGSSIGVTEDGHYAFFNSSDPPAEKNYYLYKVFKNDTSVLNASQIAVFDDRFLAPVILFSRLPGRYESGDKVVLRLYSLSKAGYEFYNGLSLQLQNDGGFFSTPPANAPTNLTGGALGFFQASSLATDSVTVP